MGTFIWLTAFALPLFLNPIVLWLLMRKKSEPSNRVWRKRAAWIGLAAGSLAYALPLVMALYNALLISTGKPVRGEQELDIDAALKVSAFLLGLAVLSGLVSPQKIRVLLVISALATGFFWITIPRSVL